MGETVIQKLDLDISGFDTGLGKTIAGYDELDARAKKSASINPFKEQADDVVKFNGKLKEGQRVFADLAKGPQAVKNFVSQLSGEVVRYNGTVSRAVNAGGWKGVQSAIAAVRTQIAAANAELEETPDHTKEAESGFSRLGERIKTALEVTGVLFLIDKIVDLGKEIIGVTGESEKFQNQFTRIFEGNGKAAAGYLATLQKTADTTNFTFDELANNSAKLASRGIIPTEQELLKLGDTANFINKPFEQLNEAILDANNPERWKELGFVVTTTGNKMTLSYGDFTKTVDKSVKGAYDAIQAFAAQGKVLGSTAEAGKTLSGRISTLEDSFAGLLRTIGQSTKGALNGAIDLITDLIQGGIALYKTLSPALDGLGNAFLAIGKAIGPAINALLGFDDQAHTTATGAQRFGYYLTKYVINPLAGIALVVAGAIEGIAQLFLYLEYAGAKVRGDKSLAAALDEQLQESKKRIKAIQEELAKPRGSATLQEYVNKDNQANRRAERRARLSTEEYEGFKPKPTDTKPPTDPKAAKAAEDERKRRAVELAKANEKQLADQKKFNQDLLKLGDDFAKDELEQLDKNSNEYITKKRDQDLKRIEEERQAKIQEGQLQYGTNVYNEKTKQYERKPNLNYKLPEEIEAGFTARKTAVSSKAENDFYQGQQSGQDAREAQKEADKKHDIEKKSDDLLLQLRQKLVDEEGKITRSAGESEIDYEQRKSKALLQIKLDYYEKLLAIAKQDPSNKKQIQDLVEQVAGAKKEIDAIDKKGKSGPGNIFELLGITVKDKSGKDITDEVAKTTAEAADLAINTANQVLAAQVASDQARVQSIDTQLQVKQNEVQVEAELAAAGLANNLTQKKEEEAALQQQRKQAIAAQARDQAIQIGLNLALQESEMALALAKTIRGAADYPPPFGLILAGVQVAAMLALFASSLTQINALPKYHDGDEVTPETARRRALNGNRKADEVDARLQIGEGVINKRSYQANKRLLQFINAAGRPVDLDELSDYVRATPFGMVESQRQQDMEQIVQYQLQGGYQPDLEVRKQLSELNTHVKDLAYHTKRAGQAKTETLSNGTIRETDADGNVSLFRRH